LQLYDLFLQATQKARNNFLDRGLSTGRQLGFKTDVLFVDGELHEALVTRGIDSDLRQVKTGAFYAIPVNPEAPTHYITNPDNHKFAAARIKFLLKNGGWVDPFQLPAGKLGVKSDILEYNEKVPW
jgi:hypothetical protein